MVYTKTRNGTITMVIVIILCALLLPIGLSLFYSNQLTQYKQSILYMSAPENPLLFFIDFEEPNYSNFTLPLELTDLPEEQSYEFNRTFIMKWDNNTETNTTIDLQYYNLTYSNITYGINYTFNFPIAVNQTINFSVYLDGATEVNFNLSLYMNFYVFEKTMYSLNLVWLLIPLMLTITIILFVVGKMRLKV